MKALKIFTIMMITAAGILGAEPPQQFLEQARRAMRLYDFEAAASYYASYQAALKKQKLPVDSAALAESRTIERLEQALENVGDIVVLDSMGISLPLDAHSLAKIKLPASAGKLITANEAKFINNPEDVDGVVYVSADGFTALWSAPGPKGNNVIYEGTLLANGNWEIEIMNDIPAPAYAPFMLDDGMTLYYATDSHLSLGGRDIMITFRDALTEPWRTPANIGMPLNSSSDELLYVASAADSIGWLITNRTTTADDIATLYVLEHTYLRSSLPQDVENRAARARLSSVRDTWPEGFDPDMFLARLNTSPVVATPNPEEVNTHSLPEEKEIHTAQRALAKMYAAWGHGDHSDELRNRINKAEVELDYLRARYQQKLNKVLKKEGHK